MQHPDHCVMDGSSSLFLAAPVPQGRAQDHCAELRLAASALLEAGHRRLAVVAPHQAEAEYRALCGMLADRNLPPPQRIETGGCVDTLDRAFFNVFRGTRYPTGLLCAGAETEQAARQSLYELGFRTPEDMMVARFAAAAAVQESTPA